MRSYFLKTKFGIISQPITISDINTSLGGPNIPGTLTLSASTFNDDAGLTSLFQQYFFDTQQSITIANTSNYNYDDKKSVISFSGTGQGGPFDKMTITAVTIEIQDGNPQLSIIANAADGWTLYPAFNALRAPLIREITFLHPQLSWFSYTDPKGFVPGFNFTGELDLNFDSLHLLQFMFQEKALTVSGQIQFDGTANNDIVQYVPDFLLVMDDSDYNASVSNITIYGPTVSLYSNSFFNTFDCCWQTDSFLQVNSQINFNGSWIQFICTLKDRGEDILLEAIMDSSINATFSDLAGYIGIHQADLDLDGFTFPADLVLKDLKICYAYPVVKFISLTIGITPDNGQPWVLWNNISLNNIEVSFMISPAAKPALSSAQISGTVNEWLALSAGMASGGEYTFYGDMTNPVKLGDAIVFLCGSSVTDVPDLTIDELEFEVSFTSGQPDFSFSGAFSLTGTWTIVSQPAIIFNGLQFNIAHKDGSYSLDANAVFQISDYYIALKGTYSNTGWSFDGNISFPATGDGSLSIGDIAADIDNLFTKQTGSSSLPPFLADWYVQDLDLKITTQQATGERDFEFTLSAANSQYSGIDLQLHIHLINSGAAYTQTFTGQVFIDTTNFDMQFDLTFAETVTKDPNPSTTYKTTGKYSSDRPPSLSDFLAFVAQSIDLDVDLPSETNLDAHPQAFALTIHKKDQDPTVMELAGQFALNVAGSEWDLYFAYTNDTTPAGSEVFGTVISGLLDLSHLPLVGQIAGVDSLKIDKLGFFYTNATFPNQDSTLQFTVPELGINSRLAPDPTSAALTHTGFSLIAVLGNQSGAGKQSSSLTGLFQPSPLTAGNPPPVTASGTMAVPLDTGQAASNGSGSFASNQAISKDPLSWIAVNKTFGPLTLQKVGLGYDGPADPTIQLGTISVYFDGSIVVGGLGLALENLGISFTIPKPGNGSFNPIQDIDFHLGGLFMNYQAPDLNIAGGFINIPGEGTNDKGNNFIGELMVQAGNFNLQAYGGFSDQLASPSLFLFLHLDTPLGGPPFFFIKGLSGGFGVNRAFQLPTFDQLISYPLLPSSNTIPTPTDLPADPLQRLDAMTTALTGLAQYLQPQEGEYWLAAGLDVSSFDMIGVSAVLSFAFGVNFRIGLVGVATMSLPNDETAPLAYIQINFEVTFSPSDGLLAAMGQITPASFIYADFVHLTGGFAFYTWFSGPDQGDFVLTIGGYNAQYQKPANYPDVPRLQMKFSMNSLDVTGQSYFALTPQMMMAGIDIHATWSSGPLDAWFDAGLDILINWKPFHYQADGHIDIGISLNIDLLFCTVRITIHAGIDLDIWGPDFGGQAVVDLDIVSFTISFGAEADYKTVASWEDFRAFLPGVDGDPPSPQVHATLGGTPDNDNKPLTNIIVSQGLVKQFKPGEDPKNNLDWLIDPDGFEIQTQSTAPCTDASFNSQTSLNGYTSFLDPIDLPGSVATALKKKDIPPFFACPGTNWPQQSFGIPPMNLKNIKSLHAVTLQFWDDTQNTPAWVPATKLILVVETQNVPSAIWGNQGNNPPSLSSGEGLLSNVPGGFSILPMIWFPQRTTLIPYYYLVYDTNNLFLTLSAPAVINNNTIDYPTLHEDLDSGTLFSNTTAVRKSIVDVLCNNGYDLLKMTNDSALNTAQYTDYPFLTYMSHTDENDFSIANTSR